MPLRRLVAATVAALAISAVPAFAGSHIYANGTLGGGGTWTNPPGSNAFMNFNRMSIHQSATVHVLFINTGGGVQHERWGVGFVQTPLLGGHSRARCKNNNGGAVSGYCAWYD